MTNKALDLPEQVEPEEARRIARRKMIGGSDAAAILGLSPFRSGLDVWADKLGLIEREMETEPMLWGKLLEPIIAGRYKDETGRNIRKPPGNFGIIRHPEHEWLGGSIDRLVVGEERLVEIKTAGYDKGWGPAGTDQVPDDYFVQVQHYLCVTGYPIGDCAVLIGGNKFRIYTIHADPELHKMMIERFRVFWEENVLGGKQPSIEGSEVCKRYISARYPKSTERVISAGADLERLAAELKEARDNFAAAESNKLLAENQIKALMQDAEAVQGGDWRITWKSTKDREAIDWRAIALELKAKPELIAKHSTRVPGFRPFRCYFAGDKKREETNDS